MQKYIFLLPLYNDWESLTLLLTKINEEIKSKNKIADILVINDLFLSSENVTVFYSSILEYF